VLGLHSSLRSFDDDVRSSGGVLHSAAIGIRQVCTERVIGSVGRARNMRSDFFYRRGNPMTGRFRRIDTAMERGAALPPVELYRVRRPGHASGSGRVSEYYVLDGHHRLAMARRLGQLYVDAHITEFTLAADGPGGPSITT
jgi:hypothetical protein